MEKVTATLTAGQLAWLKARAAALGITVSELLRRLVDQERKV
jgi:hypothetical protein